MPWRPSPTSTRRLHPGERLYECIVQEARARNQFPVPREYLNIYREPEPGVWRANITPPARHRRHRSRAPHARGDRGAPPSHEGVRVHARALPGAGAGATAGSGRADRHPRDAPDRGPLHAHRRGRAPGRTLRRRDRPLRVPDRHPRPHRHARQAHRPGGRGLLRDPVPLPGAGARRQPPGRRPLPLRHPRGGGERARDPARLRDGSGRGHARPPSARASASARATSTAAACAKTLRPQGALV